MDRLRIVESVLPQTAAEETNSKSPKIVESPLPGSVIVRHPLPPPPLPPPPPPPTETPDDGANHSEPEVVILSHPPSASQPLASSKVAVRSDLTRPSAIDDSLSTEVRQADLLVLSFVFLLVSIRKKKKKHNKLTIITWTLIPSSAIHIRTDSKTKNKQTNKPSTNQIHWHPQMVFLCCSGLVSHLIHFFCGEWIPEARNFCDCLVCFFPFFYILFSTINLDVEDYIANWWCTYVFVL